MLFNLTGNICKDLPLLYHSPCCTRFPLDYLCSHSPTTVYNDATKCSENCFVIDRVDSFKYLGITLDLKLCWQEHTNSLKLYLNNAVRQFYHLSLYCQLPILKSVYNGLIQSKLQYGLSCWGGTHSYKLDALFVKQKHAIRIMFKVQRRTPSFELLKKLKILPLRHLYVYKELKMF